MRQSAARHPATCVRAPAAPAHPCLHGSLHPTPRNLHPPSDSMHPLINTGMTTTATHPLMVRRAACCIRSIPCRPRHRPTHATRWAAGPMHGNQYSLGHRPTAPTLPPTDPFRQLCVVATMRNHTLVPSMHPYHARVHPPPIRPPTLASILPPNLAK